MMDYSNHSSFSSVVSAITLDEAIRASNHQRLMASTAVAAAATSSAAGGGRRVSRPSSQYVAGPPSNDTPTSSSSTTFRTSARGLVARGPPSYRRVFKTFSGRSSGSISTMKMDEEGDGYDYGYAAAATAAVDASTEQERFNRDDSSFLDCDDPLPTASHENGNDFVATNGLTNSNRTHCPISRFDLVCPRRGSDEMLKLPRHDVFDDYDDEDSDEEKSMYSANDSDNVNNAAGRATDTMISASLPSSLSRPWNMDGRPKRRGSVDIAPIPPPRIRTNELESPASKRSDTYCQSPFMMNSTAAPLRRHLSQSNDYCSSLVDVMSIRRDGSEVKKFVSADLPLSKPVRHHHDEDDDQPHLDEVGRRRQDEISPDRLKMIRASILPLSKPVRQKSGKMSRNDSRNQLGDVEKKESAGHMEASSGIFALNLPLSSGPKIVPPKASPMESTSYYTMPLKGGPKIVPSKASIAKDPSSTVAPKGTMASPRKKGKFSPMSEIRRRSLGRLCHVSSPIPRSLSTGSSLGLGKFKRSHVAAVLSPSAFDHGEKYGEMGMPLDGDACYPSTPKKMRRHSTPWMTYSTDRKTKPICVSNNSSRTDLIDQTDEVGVGSSIPYRTDGLSPQPTPPAPPSSPTAVDHSNYFKSEEYKQGGPHSQTEQGEKSFSRFDPMSGSSGHSRDNAMMLVKPPERQESNLDLALLSDEVEQDHQEQQQHFTSPSVNDGRLESDYNFMPMSLVWAESFGSSPPKMPKRKSSVINLHELHRTIDDNDEEEKEVAGADVDHNERNQDDEDGAIQV